MKELTQFSDEPQYVRRDRSIRSIILARELGMIEETPAWMLADILLERGRDEDAELVRKSVESPGVIVYRHGKGTRGMRTNVPLRLFTLDGLLLRAYIINNMGRFSFSSVNSKEVWFKFVCTPEISHKHIEECCSDLRELGYVITTKRTITYNVPSVVVKFKNPY